MGLRNVSVLLPVWTKPSCSPSGGLGRFPNLDRDLPRPGNRWRWPCGRRLFRDQVDFQFVSQDLDVWRGGDPYSDLFTGDPDDRQNNVLAQMDTFGFAA